MPCKASFLRQFVGNKPSPDSEAFLARTRFAGLSKAKKMVIKINEFRIVGFDCEIGGQGLCQAGRISEHPRLAPL